jgi:hypothetical protein
MSRFLLAIILGLSACSSPKLVELDAPVPITLSDESTAVEPEAIAVQEPAPTKPTPVASEPGSETTPVNWLATVYPIAILVFAGSLILFYFQRKIRVKP